MQAFNQQSHSGNGFPNGASYYPHDVHSNNYSIARPSPFPLGGLTFKRASVLLAIVALTNAATYVFSGANWFAKPESERLYLIDEANTYIDDINGFELKVREVSEDLHIPAEWLMAVMYSESRLDPKAVNRKGSGAVGLIQWMPATAEEMLGTTTAEIRKLNAAGQLDHVYTYLQRIREKYGEYESLTDLYLAILYPKARSAEESCFVMYAKPSIYYEQNAGLDENRDGRVTIADIDKRMRRLYPTAYTASY